MAFLKNSRVLWKCENTSGRTLSKGKRRKLDACLLVCRWLVSCQHLSDRPVYLLIQHSYHICTDLVSHKVYSTYIYEEYTLCTVYWPPWIGSPRYDMTYRRLKSLQKNVKKTQHSITFLLLMFLTSPTIFVSILWLP